MEKSKLASLIRRSGCEEDTGACLQREEESDDQIFLAEKISAGHKDTPDGCLDDQVL